MISLAKSMPIVPDLRPTSSVDPWEQFLARLDPVTRASLNKRRVEVLPPHCCWHLLVVAEGREPSLKQFEDVASLREAIISLWPTMNLLQEDVWIFVFIGVQAEIVASHGKFKQHFLKHPMGELLPLFDPIPPVSVLADGQVTKREEPEVAEADLEDTEETENYNNWEDAEIDDQGEMPDAGEDLEPVPGDDVSEEEPS